MKKILLIAFLAVSIVTTVAIAKTSNETQAKKQVNAIGWNSTSRPNLPTPIGTSATTADSACAANAQTNTMDLTRNRPMVVDNAASAAEAD